MKTKIVRMKEDEIDREQIKAAADILKKGGLVAFPTETVYGLGGNAFDPQASEKIYAAKGRPSDNPLIVHIARKSDLYRVAKNVPDEAAKLAEELWPGPLTMVLEKTEDLPKETTGGLDTVAVRCPSERIARALIEEAGGFIAAPSANLSGKPSTTKGEHVIRDMDGRIDMILCAEDCEIGLESTIVDLTVDPPAVLRPGYYSADRIKEVIKKEVLSEKGMTDPNAAPKAPGMKYRHYAPKAELVLVKGRKEEVHQTINALCEQAKMKDFKAAVICSQETEDLYHCDRIFTVGSIEDEEMIARRLYDVLRQIDDTDTQIIYSEAFETPILGGAIMNRMKKAAGGRIISAKGEI